MSDAAYNTSLEKIAAVNRMMTELYTEKPFNNTEIDYDAMINFYRDPTYDEEGYDGLIFHLF